MTPRAPDRLLLLEVFLRVLERGTVNRAAEDLGMSQGRASKLLRALEDQVGTPLVERGAHRVVVTPAGTAFAQNARSLVDSWHGLLDEHAGASGGRARLSVVTTTELGPDALSELVTRGAGDESVARLRWEEEDAAIAFHRIGCDVWVRVGEVADDTLVVKTVGCVDTVLVAAPDHEPAAAVREPADLAGLDAVGRPQPPDDAWQLRPAHGPARDRAHDAGREEAHALAHGRTDASRAADACAPTCAVAPRFRFVTEEPRRTRQAVLRGLGLAALPLPWVHGDLEAGTLVRVLPRWILERRPVHVVHAPDRYGSGPLGALVDALRRGIPDIPGVDAP